MRQGVAEDALPGIGRIRPGRLAHERQAPVAISEMEILRSRSVASEVVAAPEGGAAALALGCVGRLELHRGRYGDAVAVFERAIDRAEQAVGPDHSITGDMLNDMSFGLLRLGRLIKYIPYQVVSGYLSGVGVIIALGQLPKWLGLPNDVGLIDGLLRPELWRGVGIIVGLATMGLSHRELDRPATVSLSSCCARRACRRILTR